MNGLRQGMYSSMPQCNIATFKVIRVHVHTILTYTYQIFLLCAHDYFSVVN